MTRFLIVEDDPAVVRAMARSLKPFGVCEFAFCVTEAINLLPATFDGIIADLALPDGSGFDVFHHVSPEPFPPARLIVSGSVDAERLSQAHAIGAHFLLKPADAEHIRLFALRAERRRMRSVDPLSVWINEWTRMYQLTSSEADVLRLAASGHGRDALHALRGVELSTIKKQVAAILRKTLDSSLETAVSRLLRDALGAPPVADGPTDSPERE